MSKGLEALDKLHTKINILDTEQDLYNYCLTTIEKELKAFEIIKPFLKNIRIVENEKGQWEVLIDVINSDKPLVIAILETQEEYELLKEMLL